MHNLLIIHIDNFPKFIQIKKLLFVDFHIILFVWLKKLIDTDSCDTWLEWTRSTPIRLTLTVSKWNYIRLTLKLRESGFSFKLNRFSLDAIEYVCKTNGQHHIQSCRSRWYLQCHAMQKYENDVMHSGINIDKILAWATSQKIHSI